MSWFPQVCFCDGHTHKRVQHYYPPSFVLMSAGGFRIKFQATTYPPPPPSHLILSVMKSNILPFFPRSLISYLSKINRWYVRYVPFVSPPCSPTSLPLPYYDSRSTSPPPYSPLCLLAYKDPTYSPIKLFIRAGMVDRLPLTSALKPWGEQGGALDIVRAKAGSYTCHREGTICIDSSVGIIFFVVVANDQLSICPP